MLPIPQWAKSPRMWLSSPHLWAYIVAALGLIYLGTRLHGSSAQLEQRTSEVTRLQQSLQESEARLQKMQQDQHVVTVTVTRPDGTKTSTTTADTHTSRQSSDTTQVASETKEESKKQSETAEAAKYSVGLTWSPASWPTGRPTGAELGARLGSLPLWMEVGAQWAEQKQATLGLRLEF